MQQPTEVDGQDTENLDNDATISSTGCVFGGPVLESNLQIYL